MTWREYHDATKHTPESLRRSTFSLEWANMPDPFRHYEGVPVLDLPADPPSPSIPVLDLLGGRLGSTASGNGPELVSQLLFYSAAISASKVAPSTGDRYALRVNPSSGNLHPTEFHFCAQGLPDWPDGLYHYRPSSHMAEQRASGNFASTLGVTAPLVFILTSIAWREAWKYRDRAYRYCLLDTGHAGASLILAAQALGYSASYTGEFPDDSLARLCGLSGDEWPMLIVAVGESAQNSRGRRTEDNRQTVPCGEPNALSTRVVAYPAIEAVHEETKLADPAVVGAMRVPRYGSKTPVLPSLAFGEAARQRRSALDFVGGNRAMARDQLLALLEAAAPRSTSLHVYVHRADGFDRGVYKYVNGTGELELIRAGDQRIMAAALSLQQELAGNACIAISMVAQLDRVCAKHGPRGYRYAHFEAGEIGQRLYLAAEGLGLRATGMGAFFDDETNRYLNLRPSEEEVIYHFAIGYPVYDPRLEAQL